MNKRFFLMLTIAGFLTNLSLAANDDLIRILKEELDREVHELSGQNPAPYYIEYRVDEIHSHNLRASFGSLVGQNNLNSRLLTVMVRVGDYSFDNTHNLQGNFSMSEQMEVYGTNLPVENDPDAIKQVIWRITDQAYKNASGRYTSLKNMPLSDNPGKSVPDFSKEEPGVYFDPPFSENELQFDESEWIQRLKDYTSLLSEDSLIFHNEAILNSYMQREYLLTSEGTCIAQNTKYCQLQFLGSIRHKNGMVLPLQKSYTAFRLIDLPSQEKLIDDFKALYLDLLKMNQAVMAEPYAGPAILSPSASGIFFHEIFGHRVEGHRLESLDDGQTFKDKLGTEVLPEGFTVYSDPTQEKWQGQDLIGTYKYDDQGVKARKVILVENGILKDFLMSRRPIQEKQQSNGHGRAQAGYSPVSRQSNLFIESSVAYNDDDLRKMLIKECKKQKKEYGYYFKEVVGGLTFTDRYNANVFNVNPTEVYRIYVDGRPDELVYGVELIGTPLTMFSNIIAAGHKRKVFTGFCGAESGNIPVTTIAPALLVRKIETQKAPEYNSQLPLLPNPDRCFDVK
jgi:TldD protein